MWLEFDDVDADGGRGSVSVSRFDSSFNNLKRERTFFIKSLSGMECNGVMI